MIRVEALDHLVLTVRDPEATAAFFRDALGMRPERFRAADGGMRLALKFGGQKINLHAAGAEFRPHTRAPLPGSADLCFLTRAPLADWQAHLAALGIAVEEGPVPRTGAAGPVISLYLRDPDENLIEIARPV